MGTVVWHETIHQMAGAVSGEDDVVSFWHGYESSFISKIRMQAHNFI